MKAISDKMRIQKAKERELSKQLIEECQGLCSDCGSPGDWRGISKHEIKFRSHGGDPLDRNNVLMLCGKCHSKRHHLKEV